MLRRLACVLLVAVVSVAGVSLAATATAATATPSSSSAPTPITVPGGVSRDGKILRVAEGGRVVAAQESGNCSDEGVHCKPELEGTCTGNTDQVNAPETIRVLVGKTNPTIKVVKFRDYVADSLYNEWVPTWDGDAVKAGAVAVKSFAWYWITQRFGGYVGSAPSATNCFDISDDPNYFQKYVAGTGTKDATTVARVSASWPVAVRSEGRVVETHYQDGFSADPSDDTCGYGAGGTPDSAMSQYGTQACNEVNDGNNGYRYNVILRLYYGKDIDLNSTAQLRTQHDFNFTHRSTAAALTAGNWLIADGYPTSFRFGNKGDVPVAATTGDGFANAAVYRPSTSVWYLANSLHQLVTTTRFGNVGDVPVAAHYRGLNAPTQLAVFRPKTGVWYFAGSGGTIASTYTYGVNGDVPVPGRWVSTTADAIGIWRPSTGTWYVPGQAPISWGLRGDVLAPADYNGDGKTDVAVYRPSTHAFYVRNMPRVVWGVAGDVPVTGDFDGDGTSDFAVYRPSNGNVYVHNQAAVVNIGKNGSAVGAAPFRG